MFITFLFANCSRDSCTVVLVDGAAFGFYMNELLPMIKENNIYLVAIESFEYVILRACLVSLHLCKKMV